MKLSKLLEGITYTCLQGRADIEIAGVAYDSRKAEDGFLFVCMKGKDVDGHRFAASAVEKGAAALLVEDPVDVPEDVTVMQVEDSRYALAILSAEWFGHPAEKLTTIGVTGTKGRK